VLVVDDNEVNRRVLREILTSWKMRTGEADSGETALTALRAASAAGDPYRIAITDFRMPVMDGEVLGRTVKADPVLADTALVLLSSVGQQGEAARFRDAGFAAYLVKPVRASQLMDALITAWAALTRLPAQAAPARAPAARSERRTIRPLARPAHVLVVEDNWVNQQVAMGTLAKLGCRVDVAGGGREALERLRATAYDVVFMDCEMPDMDGYATTAEIRRQEGPAARIPIVAMTAHAMEGDRERCLAAGMDDYLSKPLELPAVHAALERWTPKPAEEPTRSAPDPARLPLSSLVVDADRVSRLRATLTTGGNASLFARVLRGFIADTSERVEALRRSVELGEAEAAQQVAHALRGSCANIGVTRMANVAEALERLATTGRLDGAQALVQQLVDEFRQAEAALAPELGGTPT
jgi:CheY-like chemotaxis protein/HPt (histidine-containing phosphotransfer) domain-containing protein